MFISAPSSKDFLLSKIYEVDDHDSTKTKVLEDFEKSNNYTNDKMKFYGAKHKILSFINS